MQVRWVINNTSRIKIMTIYLEEMGYSCRDTLVLLGVINCVGYLGIRGWSVDIDKIRLPYC